MLLAGLQLKQTMTLTSNCSYGLLVLLALFNDFLLFGVDSPVSYEGLQTSKLLEAVRE